MGKLFESFGKICFSIAITYLMLCLTTYIVMDVADLFNVNFITQLGYISVFGIIFIIHLIKIDSKSVREYLDKPSDDSSNSLVVSFVQTILLLLVWGVAYVSFWMLVQ
jgi:hypothetical protein